MATNPERYLRRTRYYPTGRFRYERPMVSANRAIGSEGRTLLNEAHALARENDSVESALNSWEANTVGTGIRLRLQLEDQDKQLELIELWQRSQAQLDADGMQDFYGMQALVSRSVVEGGEVFARMRLRRPEDGLIVPFQLQLLEADMLPYGALGELKAGVPAGHTLDWSIQRDSIGRRVAYHFYRNHPGDGFRANAASGDTVPVPADQILHMGVPKRPGQIRFASHLAPSMAGLKTTDDANMNMAERIRTGALFTGFITRPLGEEEEGEQATVLGEGQADEDGQAITTTLEAGSIVNLDDGETVYFPDPPDIGTNYIPFIEGYARRFSMGLGLTYEQVTGNMQGVTFSSARVAALEMRRRLEQFVTRCLVHQFCSKVWRAWLREAVLSGAIDLPGFEQDPTPYYKVEWRHPGWPYVNPVQEAQAALIDVQAGFNSRDNVVLSKGLDPEVVDQANEKSWRRAEQLDLFYTSDPRHNLPESPRADGEASGENVS